MGSGLTDIPRPQETPCPSFLPSCLSVAWPQPWSFTTQMCLQGRGIWVLQIHLQLDHQTVGFHKSCWTSKLSWSLGLQSQGDTEQGGGAKATCGASHISGVINLDRDTISSTCSLSTSVSWRDTPWLFPGGVFFGTGGGFWWLIRQVQDRSSHIYFLENSMV